VKKVRILPDASIISDSFHRRFRTLN